MTAEPIRYQQRPPQVDAMRVLPETVNDVCAWLNREGWAGYVDGEALYLVPPEPDPRGALFVRFGGYLLLGRQGWGVCAPDAFEERFEATAVAKHRDGR